MSQPGGWIEAWITTVCDDDDAAKALMLAASLKQVETNRKLVVVSSQNVSSGKKSQLKQAYDAFFLADSEYKSFPGMSEQVYLQMSCLTLPFIRNAIYINPNTVLIANADDFFELLPDGHCLRGDILVMAKFVPNNKRFSDILLAWGKQWKMEGWTLKAFGGQILVPVFVLDNQNGQGTGLEFTNGINGNGNGASKLVCFTKTHPAKGYVNGSTPSLPKMILNWMAAYAETFGTPKTISFNHKKEPIAVVGMACRFASANDPEEFWKMMIAKEDGVCPVPNYRWTPDLIPGVTEEDRKGIEAAFLRYPVECGDPKFFGMSPFEFQFADPQQRILLEVAWEALEDAGMNPHSLKGSNTGVFTGTWTTDYKDFLVKYGTATNELYRTYMGNSIGATSAKLSHFLGTVGPNIATESGCSSAMVAVGLALRSLRDGNCKVALACGANLILRPFSYKDLGPVLSPSGRSKTFDADADGFGRGEGCGVLVLKRLSDAIQDGDQIHGLIRGYGEAQEGTSRSMGTPSVEVEALAMSLALEDAGINPADVSYIEAHGTGTQIGDAVEIEAISRVYAKRDSPLVVASVKPNIGHTESCSGIAGIIKTLLAFKHELIPPHVGCEKLNPHIKLDKIPAVIPFQEKRWKRNPTMPRLAGVSAFGITGTDAHVILQEPPVVLQSHKKMQNCLNILTISARTEESLDNLITLYGQKIKQESLSDVAFTANTGRAHLLPHRVAVIAKDTLDLLRKLTTNAASGIIRSDATTESQKCCFMFAGQGSQYLGMGQTLASTFPVFKENIEQCFKILEEKYEIKELGKKIIWGYDPAMLNDATISQLAVFCVEYAMFKLWESWGIKPDCVLGHSMGEFAAASAAGIFSLDDALMLLVLRQRSSNTLEMEQGAMLSILADGEEVTKLLVEVDSTHCKLDISCFNSPSQTVVGGRIADIDKLEKLCEAKKIKTTRIKTTRAYHTRLMESLVPNYQKLLKNVTFHPANCTYISGTTGTIINCKEEMNAGYWIRNLLQPVQFISAVNCMLDIGVNFCLECSPHPVLAGLVASNTNEIRVLPTLKRGKEEMQALLESLASMYVAGADINWNSFHKALPGKKVSLPHYPFQRRSYWAPFHDQEKMLMQGKIVHPILGCPVNNPTSTKMFKSFIHVKDELVYLEDHKVGKYTIFPAAGFVEVSLAAARSLFFSNEKDECSVPLSVKNLMIQAPLDLSNCGDEGCELHTVLTPEEAGGSMQLKIYRNVLNKSWVSHSMGNICLGSSDITSNKQFVIPPADNTTSESVLPSEFYERLAEVGLNFGPNFRSLSNLWKCDSSSIIGGIIAPDSEQCKKYLCHPVVIDAMLQASIFHQRFMSPLSPQLSHLCLPVSIKEFIVYATSGCPKYIHCYALEETKEQIAVLYDERGVLLACMKAPELAETKLAAITHILESQRVQLPTIFEETWNPAQTIEEDISVFSKYDCTKDTEELEVGQLNELNKEATQRTGRVTSNVILAKTVEALKNLGWTFKVGDDVDLDECIRTFQICPKNRMMFRAILITLVEDGYLQLLSDFKFRVLKPFPSERERGSLMEEALAIWDSEYEVRMTAGCAERLAGVLQGKDTVLPILFPSDEETVANVEHYYSEGLGCAELNMLVERLVEKLVPGKCENGRVLRILEVGAGTGSATVLVLPVLQKYCGIQFSYTYTDLSPVLFHRAEKKFASYQKQMSYKLLNLEEDPLAQGFSPYDFDLVISANVVHATRDLKETMQHISLLMKPGSILLIAEVTQPMRISTCTFGLIDGWWRFRDYGLRKFSPLLSSQEWVTFLKGMGFSNVKEKVLHIVTDPSISSLGDFGVMVATKPTEGMIFQSHQSKSWLVFGPNTELRSRLFKTLTECGRQCIIVEYKETNPPPTRSYYVIPPDSQDAVGSILKEFSEHLEGVLFLGTGEEISVDPCEYQRILAQGFLNFSKSLVSTKFKRIPRVILAVEGMVHPDGVDAEPIPPIAGCVWGMMKTLKGEFAHIPARCVDLDSTGTPATKVSHLLKELWNDDIEFGTAYRSSKKYLPSGINFRSNDAESLELPQTQHYSLALPSSKSIQDLKFIPVRRPDLPPHGIEVAVKAAGLNFKDVLNVIKPDEQFANSNSVGADVAGIITAVGPEVTKWKIGDAVIGCNFEERPLPTHVRTLESAVVALPNHVTFEEGATLPAVFATAYHCLIDVGKLRKGETILIHTASGGVGIVAIQIAKQLGANIIVTAGSKRKRAFLREIVGLSNVFDSRNLSFAQSIKSRGISVNFVLNSLTGPGFKEASLSVLEEGGRFIEMSKLNTWTTAEVKDMRPDIDYTMIDLTAVSKETWVHLFEKLGTWLKEGKVCPIPYTKFHNNRIREALTYLQKAKHIGKVIVVPPTLEHDKNCQSQLAPKFNLFNDRSTYLITGGLGGIGLEVGKWMLAHGARYLVLVGRRPPLEQVCQQIREIEERTGGSSVTVLQADVGKFEDCERVLNEIRTRDLPPLRGIMHAAGTLDDDALLNQTWQKHEHCFNAKVKGSWNLHNLTINFNLEHFVLFSSVAAVLGSIGQSNHVAANTFMDALARYRDNLGLPALSINWGQWAEVGVAADLKIKGIIPFSPAQGLKSLEVLLQSGKRHAMVFQADFSQLKTIYPWITHYFTNVDCLIGTGSSSKKPANKLDISSDKFWSEYDASKNDSDAQFEIVQGLLLKVVSHILRLDTNESLNVHASLKDVGFDSLMTIEMKNLLQELFKTRVTFSITQFQDCQTVALLAKRIHDIIEGKDQGTQHNETDLEELVVNDCKLPQNLTNLIEQSVNAPVELSEIKTILLTGCNGYLGSYVLKELLKLPHISRIFCLVRCSNKEEGMKRILNSLKSKDLLESELENITVIPGDITKDGLGMEETSYSTLASEVDAIFNCAVVSNHLERYSRSSSSRITNVLGTLNLIKFAFSTRIKWIYHASSLLYACMTHPDAETIPETWPEMGKVKTLLKSSGYCLSKLFGDHLLSQISDKVPTKVFRFTYLAGDSRNGQSPIEGNHIFLRYVSYFQLKCIPSSSSLSVPLNHLPIDVAAAISVSLFFHVSAPLGVYNIANPKFGWESELIPMIAKELEGMDLEEVEFHEFIGRMDVAGDNVKLNLFKDLYLDEMLRKEAMNAISLYGVRENSMDNYFDMGKVTTLFPDWSKNVEDPGLILKRDLIYALTLLRIIN